VSEYIGTDVWGNNIRSDSPPELIAAYRAERNGHEVEQKNLYADVPPPDQPPDEDETDATEPSAHDILRQAGMVSAAELDRKKFPPMQWHVPGLVPEGFGLLVAPPKAGKSWLVADTGLACASGGKAFDCIDVQPRPVCYLALEDGPRRLCRTGTVPGRVRRRPPADHRGHPRQDQAATRPRR
jgi:hypothetical protein